MLKYEKKKKIINIGFFLSYCKFLCFVLLFLLFFVVPVLPYLGLETLNQDGHQQVEEDVVAKGHKGDKVEGGYGRGGGHTVI